MKKILIVVHTANFIRQFELENIKLLQSAGCEVHCAADMTPHPPVSDFGEYFTSIGIIPHATSIRRSPLSLKNLKAINEVKKILIDNGIDGVHCHTPMGGVVARLAAKKVKKVTGKRIDVIYTAHGFHFFKGAPLINWLIYYPIEKYMSKHTDCVVTINTEDYARAKKKFKRTSVEYIPGIGINTNKFVALTDDGGIRSEFNIPPAATVLLSVGELNKNKNHTSVIKAVAKTKRKDIYYLIAGVGGHKDALQTQIDKLGLHDRIFLTGYRTDIGKLLVASDIFCFPSLREGLSVALMEAMASGKPCIVSEIRGNTQLIDDSEGGYLLTPKDISGFAEKIEAYADDNTMRIRAGSHNKNKIKLFDTAKSNEVMSGIYGKYFGLENLSGNKKMKIAQVFHQMNIGGAETLMMSVIRNMPKDKFDFVFVVHAKEKGFYEDELISLGAKTVYAPAYSLLARRAYRKWWKEFVSAEGIDVVHCHLSYSVCDIIKALKGNGTRIFAHSHSSCSQGNVSSLKVRIKNFIVKMRKKYTVKNATQLLACSDKAGRFLFGKNARFHIVNNGVDSSKFVYDEKARKIMRNKIGLLDADIAIGIVARLSAAKNHELFIKIISAMAAKNNKVKGVIIGEGELRSEIEKRIANTDYSDAFIMTGSLTNVAMYYSALDVFVMPSLYEGLPVTLVEAQCNGIPCVISSRITKKAVLTDCVTYVDGDNPDNWANTVFAQINKPRTNRIEDIKSAGFDISSTVGDLIRLYLMRC